MGANLMIVQLKKNTEEDVFRGITTEWQDIDLDTIKGARRMRLFQLIADYVIDVGCNDCNCNDTKQLVLVHLMSQ